MVIRQDLEFYKFLKVETRVKLQSSTWIFGSCFLFFILGLVFINDGGIMLPSYLTYELLLHEVVSVNTLSKRKGGEQETMIAFSSL